MNKKDTHLTLPSCIHLAPYVLIINNLSARTSALYSLLLLLLYEFHTQYKNQTLKNHKVQCFTACYWLSYILCHVYHVAVAGRDLGLMGSSLAEVSRAVLLVLPLTCCTRPGMSLCFPLPLRGSTV